MNISKLKHFTLLTVSTLIMAVGTYFSNLQTILLLVVSPVLPYWLPKPGKYPPVIFHLS